MYKLLILLLLLSLSHFSSGQKIPIRSKVFTVVRTVPNKQPLLVIGTLETNYNSLVLNPDNIRILKTYTDSLDLIHFGEKGKDGVIVAELKKETPLLRLPDVLEYFKVPVPDRALKVLVNNSLVNPDLFLADVNRIKKIEKLNQDEVNLVRESFAKEEYLNIITVKE